MTGGAKYYVIFEGVQGMRRRPAGFAWESPCFTSRVASAGP